MYWKRVHGNLKQIDSGPPGVVWGVNRYDRVFCRIGIRYAIVNVIIVLHRILGNLYLSTLCIAHYYWTHGHRNWLTVLFSIKSCMLIWYLIVFNSILLCFVVLYCIVFYYILFYSILFYSILFYSILFYSILFYSILFFPFFSFLFYSILLKFILLCCIVLYFNVFFFIVFY